MAMGIAAAAGAFGQFAMLPGTLGLLSGLYLARGVVITLFVMAPLSVWSAYLFGVRNLSMLGGIVFLFHQLGSFMGGWLGGYVYDRIGSYDLVWQVSILLSLLAAALNWPVREQPVARLRGLAK